MNAKTTEAILTDKHVSSPPTLESIDFKKFTKRAWITFGAAALFYMYEYILRVSPSVMTDQLMRDFGVTATALGVMSSAYYYSYVALQIPCGVIADWLGPRRVITFSAILCVAGSYFFAHSDSLFMANLGRFFMGAGSACAFICCTKVGSEWFHPSKFALIAGMTQAMGLVGGTFAGRPLAMLVNSVGWREAMLIGAFSGLAVAAFAWIVIRDQPKEKAHLKKQSVAKGASEKVPLLDGIKIIMSNPQSWLIGIYGGLMYVPLSAFTELWGVPFLKSVYGLNDENAASITVMFFIGMAFGCPLAATFSNYIKSRVSVMSKAAMLTGLIFLIIVYVPIPQMVMAALLFAAGVFSGGQILYFAISKEVNPNHVSGASVGFCNCFVMITALIFQPLLGLILDTVWDGARKFDGTPLYSTEAYQISLAAVPLCLLAAWGILKFVRDTYHLSEVSDNQK